MMEQDTNTLTIRVGENGDYRSISEAVKAVPYRVPATILLGEGVFCEKVFLDKKDITLRGEGMDKTVISWADGASQLLPDNTKRGTFRSQTLFLGGEHVRVLDLTVENTAGWGKDVGQALAVYADADEVIMENVRLRSRQDTLFLAPLPTKEREPLGFFGPRMLTERKNTKQYYKNCEISGDVDFIFGGADAVFDNCTIRVLDRKKKINGYIAAPSENLGKTGFVFRNCKVVGENKDMDNTVFLGRPWRPTGKAVFLNCVYDRSVHPLRFSEWRETECDESKAFFAEYNPKDTEGKEIDLACKNKWVRMLTDVEATCINRLADKVIEEIG
jgi:pectinesterase